MTKGLDWARRLGMAFNTMLCLMGVGVGVAGLAFLLNDSRPELTQRDLLWGSLGVALVLVLTGILGMVFCSATSVSLLDQQSAGNDTTSGNLSKQRSAYKCYTLLAFLLAVSMGAALRYTAAVTLKQGNVRQHLSKLWDRVPEETALAIERLGECCGFDSYRDRIQEPCIRRHTQVGCATVMTQYYTGSTRRMVPLMWLVLVSCVLAVVSGVALWVWGEREHVFAGVAADVPKNDVADGASGDMFTVPGTPKGQSFDDWHRTIFQ